MKDDAVKKEKVTDRREDGADEPAGDLVTALRGGDEAAFERLVRGHGVRLLATGERILRDRSLAEDALQETFIAVHKNIGGYQERGSFQGWLHRIMVNQCLLRLRIIKRKNEGSIDALLPEFDGNNCRVEAPWTTLRSPEEILNDAQSRDILRSKIDELPEIYRTVLLLRGIEDLSIAEIAEALDITEGTTKVRLHRARAALKNLLEPVLRGEQP